MKASLTPVIESGVPLEPVKQSATLSDGVQPVKIEKNVPMPVGWPERKRPNEVRYRFGEMEVGDSFAIPLGKHNAARLALRQWLDRRRPVGVRFTIRRVKNRITGEVGYRCWRMS